MSMKQTLIGLGLVAASGAALALPNIAVLATYRFCRINAP